MATEDLPTITVDGGTSDLSEWVDTEDEHTRTETTLEQACTRQAPNTNTSMRRISGLQAHTNATRRRSSNSARRQTSGLRSAAAPRESSHLRPTSQQIRPESTSSIPFVPIPLAQATSIEDIIGPIGLGPPARHAESMSAIPTLGSGSVDSSRRSSRENHGGTSTPRRRSSATARLQGGDTFSTHRRQKKGKSGSQAKKTAKLAKYGQFSIEPGRKVYYDNDCVSGKVYVKMFRSLDVKRLTLRLRALFKLKVHHTTVMKVRLHETEQTLTSNVYLKKQKDDGGDEGPERYEFDFSIDMADGVPGSAFYLEKVSQGEAVSVGWSLELWCELNDKTKILANKVEIVKAAMYVPQIGLQPKIFMSKNFLDSFLSRKKKEVKVYATLDKDVYKCGEEISVRVRIRCGTRSITSITASVHQLITSSGPDTRSGSIAKDRLNFDPKHSSTEDSDRDRTDRTEDDEHIYNLTLNPKFTCSCLKHPSATSKSLCEGFAHVTRMCALIGDEVTNHDRDVLLLAPTSKVCPLTQTLGIPHVEYLVHVKVCLKGKSTLRVDIPFVLSNESIESLFANPQCQISDHARANLVSATPIFTQPPQYDNARSCSIVSSNTSSQMDKFVLDSPPSYRSHALFTQITDRACSSSSTKP